MKTIQNVLSENTNQKYKEPDIFKYLASVEVNDDILEFEDEMKKDRKKFKIKEIEY